MVKATVANPFNGLSLPDRLRKRAEHAANACQFGDEADMRDAAFQLERANKIIGWMMPYIGTMCPPSNGLYDLNIHCCENNVPEPGDETKGASIRQHAAGARPSGVV